MASVWNRADELGRNRVHSGWKPACAFCRYCRISGDEVVHESAGELVSKERSAQMVVFALARKPPSIVSNSVSSPWRILSMAPLNNVARSAPPRMPSARRRSDQRQQLGFRCPHPTRQRNRFREEDDAMSRRRCGALRTFGVEHYLVAAGSNFPSQGPCRTEKTPRPYCERSTLSLR